jgi:hypothetical protein
LNVLPAGLLDSAFKIETQTLINPLEIRFLPSQLQAIIGGIGVNRLLVEEIVLY